MDIANKLPSQLASCLTSERLSWFDVWAPLKKARDDAQVYAKTGNYMHFAYNPDAELFCVATIVVDDGEVWLTEEHFKREVGKLTRGYDAGS